MAGVLCPTCGFSNTSGATACASCGAPLPTTTSAPHVLPPGTKLSEGAYTVGKVLGQGGFGITYLGSDTRLTRAVAIKELFPAGSIRQGRHVLPAGDWTPQSFAEAKEKFWQEGHVLARFHHPSIVNVYAVFEENQTAYMVMEYLRGKSLGGLLEKRGEPLPEKEAVGYIRKVGEALEVVHGAGLLHRDVKPDNVIATDDGRVVLLDFGTAREYAAGRTKRLTAMLTPGYAPLEQYSTQARFGPFTDVYALAATLYHLLSGQPPVAALDRIQGVELPPLRGQNPQVSQAISDAVMRGLSMEVAKRPQTMREFTNLLAEPAAPAPRPIPPAVMQPARTPPPAPKAASPKPAPAPKPAPRPQKPPAPAPKPAPREEPPLRDPVALFTLAGHRHWVHSVAFSPDGRLLASGGQDNTVLLWDPRTGELLRELMGHSGPLLGMLGSVFTVAFSPDGRLLASGGNDDTVRLWDMRDGSLARTVVGRSGNVNSVAFSPDGGLLALAGEYNRIELWDYRKEKQIGVLEGHGYSLLSVAISPDGERLAAGSENSTVTVWDLSSGKGLATLAKHRAAVRTVAFSPSGAFLASGGDDYLVAVWDLKTGKLRAQLTEHGGGVRSIAFSPDSRILAAAGDDQATRLWDLRTGGLEALLTGHSGSVTSVAMSPDGRLLATGGMDQTVQLWRLR